MLTSKNSCASKINHMSTSIIHTIKMPAEPQESFVQRICDYYGVTMEQLRQKIKPWDYLLPRYIIFTGLKLRGLSLNQIGHFFAGRDHTTVRAGIIKLDDLLSTEPESRSIIIPLMQNVAPEFMSKDEFIDLVCNQYGCSRSDVFGRDPSHQTCIVRYIIWQGLIDYGLSKRSIGRMFGRRSDNIQSGLSYLWWQLRYDDRLQAEVQALYDSRFLHSKRQAA